MRDRTLERSFMRGRTANYSLREARSTDVFATCMTKSQSISSCDQPLLSKQGKAGLDAAPAVLEQLGRLRDLVVSQAPSSRRRDLQERLDLHLDEAREEVDRHLAEQRKTWHRQTAEKRQATNRAEAALSFDDFDKLMILASVNEDAAREIAKASGIEPDSDSEKKLVTQARSQTYRAAVEGALKRAGRQAGTCRRYFARIDRVSRSCCTIGKSSASRR